MTPTKTLREDVTADKIILKLKSLFLKFHYKRFILHKISSIWNAFYVSINRELE